MVCVPGCASATLGWVVQRLRRKGIQQVTGFSPRWSVSSWKHVPHFLLIKLYRSSAVASGNSDLSKDWSGLHKILKPKENLDLRTVAHINESSGWEKPS